MITVRFPSGFSVQYNSSGFIEGPDEKGVTRLREKRGGIVLIARVPKECLIEMISPCRTYNAASSSAESEMKRQLDALRKEVRTLTRKVGKVKL